MEQQETSRIEADWLPPVAALAHFEPPAGLLQIAAARQTHRKEQRARYGFRIDTLGLLIAPDAGSEVMLLPRVAPLPGAPVWFVGLVNVRGNLVPLYDLRALLDLGARTPGREPLALVLGGGENAVGVVIEGHPLPLTSLHPLSRAEVPAVPPALERLTPGAYMQDDTVWLEFDHDAFFEAVCRPEDSTI